MEAARQTKAIIGKQHMEKSRAGLLHALPIRCNELLLMVLKEPAPLPGNDCCTVQASHSSHVQALKLKIVAVVQRG